MVYYGLSLNAGSLAGDIFLNNALNACLDIVGYVIAQLFMDRWEIEINVIIVTFIYKTNIFVLLN